MKNIFLPALILSFTICLQSCDPTGKQTSAKHDQTKKNHRYWIDIDSAKKDTNNNGYYLKPLSGKLRKYWTDTFYPISDVKPLYQAYLYDYKQRLKTNLLLIFTMADDYAGIFLVSTKNGHLIDHFEISGGVCAGPSYFDNKVDWCDTKRAFFKNDSALVISILRTTSKSDALEFPKTVDSLCYLLTINAENKFKVTKTDSVRYIVNK